MGKLLIPLSKIDPEDTLVTKKFQDFSVLSGFGINLPFCLVLTNDFFHNSISLFSEKIDNLVLSHHPKSSEISGLKTLLEKQLDFPQNLEKEIKKNFPKNFDHLKILTSAESRNLALEWNQTLDKKVDLKKAVAISLLNVFDQRLFEVVDTVAQLKVSLGIFFETAPEISGQIFTRNKDTFQISAQ